MMPGRFKNRFRIPIWYMGLTALVLAALIAYGMVIPYWQMHNGVPPEPGLFSNPNIFEKMPQTYHWAENSLDAAGLLFCLFMGIVCFMLGISRNVNSLGGNQIYLLALFLALYGLHFLSSNKLLQESVNTNFLFYGFWAAYFSYSVTLFLFYFLYLKPAVQRWIWPLLAVPIGYGAAAWVMYLAFGLPFEAPDRLYTPMMIVIFILFQCAAFFGIRQRNMVWFFRWVAAFWACWAVYSFIKAGLGVEYILSREYKNGMVAMGVFFVSYLIYITMQELSAYKSDMQVLSLQNRLAKDSYEHIKTHLHQVGGLKHEIRNHLAALRVYLEDGRVEEAREYLNQYATQTAVVTDTVYNDNLLINAVVGDLLQRAGTHDIKVDLNIKAAHNKVADPELYSLLSNILDNAVEACIAMPEGRERFIRLSITRREPYIKIRCENSKDREIISEDGQIQTSKTEDGHGYGLWTIGRVVDAYDGMMDIDYDEETFTVTAALKDQ